MGEYEPNDSRNVTGTASTRDGHWTNEAAKLPKGVPNPPPHVKPADTHPRPADFDDLPPETYNDEQEDEEAQAQQVAEDFGPRGHEPVMSETEKAKPPLADNDVQDVVDHMHDMTSSGRIDYDAYRGERSDDDEEDLLGPGGVEP
ncbi:MAG: hypothetical protein WCY11_07620 [Novosphingobium sp.]